MRNRNVPRVHACACVPPPRHPTCLRASTHSSWEVDAQFPSKSVIAAFQKPQVDSSGMCVCVILDCIIVQVRVSGQERIERWMDEWREGGMDR